MPVEDGWRLVAALPDRGLDVHAAGWVRTFDDDQHWLCVVTPPDERGGMLSRYRIVVEAFRDLGPFQFRSDDIRLFRPDEPLGEGLATLRRLNPFAGTVVSSARSVGRVGVESPVVLYPALPAPTPA